TATAALVLSLVLSAAACRGRDAPSSSGGSPAPAPPATPPPDRHQALVEPPSHHSAAPRPLPLPLGEGMPVSFAPLARRADPAVATVKARVERETPSGRRRVVAEGLGTAFVYDPDGLLLTNNHVIDEASDVAVIFNDGRELSA